MNRILRIGLKDVMLLLTDFPALLFMLGAPFMLTVGMGLITGSFGDDDQVIDAVPVAIINNDTGVLGGEFVKALNSAELSSLITYEIVTDMAAIEQAITDDTIATGIIIPAGFSANILEDAAEAPVQLVANGGRPIGVGIMESVVDEFINQVSGGRVATELTLQQLAANGATIDAAQIASVQTSVRERQAAPLLALTQLTDQGAAADSISPLHFLAPSMAIFFLMFTVTLGGRSILTEWEGGTLHRLLATPTVRVQVLFGKMIGTFLIGLLQVGILVIACSLMFGLEWGDPLGVAVLVLATVAAATGWGMFLTAIVDTPTQAASIGGVLMLLFGILGGSFAAGMTWTGFMRYASLITPNAWANDGFAVLSRGGTVVDVLPISGALLLMAFLLCAFATNRLQHRWA